MNSETLSLVLVPVLIILLITIFIRVAIRLRKNGGSLVTTLFGSTYEFYNKDKKKAIEMIVEYKANKKMEEQANDKPTGEKTISRNN